VGQKIVEGGKERVQQFEGLVISVSPGNGLRKTFTVRKVVEGIGVEKVFPFHSPNVLEIRILKKANVRRSKLYYMRERFGKSARLSERHVSDEERAKEMALVEEAVTAEEKAAVAEIAESAPQEMAQAEAPVAEVEKKKGEAEAA
jgi:large subunit ribosomal protein L19